MPSPPDRVALEVAARARGLNAYVRRMERLYAAGELARPDLNRVYGGAFLSFHTYIERSLERLFLGILMRRLSLRLWTRSWTSNRRLSLDAL
jgi:hypothetical protein